ncbi:MAG: hypothetical protein K0S25_2121 [Bacillus sp. (in: firmicutes)]|jgi:diguanylate cyclase (GGDEF)-like protein|nr:hypothetical protein [Bacillus sp. (in: firmicutes)]
MSNLNDTFTNIDSISQQNIGMKICSIYALVGILWITFSDQFVVYLARDVDEMVLMSTYKGWGFILLTTLLLYILVQLFLQKIVKINGQLSLSNQSLEASYEEIAASEEELREQYSLLEQQNDALYTSEQNFRSLFDNMLTGFIVYEIIYDDKANFIGFRFLAVNPAFEKLTGLKKKDVLGRTALEIFPQTGKLWHDPFKVVADTGKPYSFTLFGYETGKYFEGTAYRPTSDRVAIHFFDCTARIKGQEEIEYMAYHDSLTQLPNRYFFQEHLRQALAANERLAVILLDLDDFKLINDTLGHASGDELLQEISRRLLSILQTEDIVSRLGGDEFIVLITNPQSLEKLDDLAQKLSRAIYEPWYYNEVAYQVSCKIGIAQFPTDSCDADTLIKQADMAMYQAKEQDMGNYLFYQSSMKVKVAERMEIERELQVALSREEFVLHYQPQVDYTGKILGVEALVRWQHPTKGLIPPMKFIPIAEESGLILPIGEWILKTACRQVGEWRKAGISPIAMSINLSARQFLQQDILDKISKIINESEVNPQQIVLEITETAAMKNAEKTVQILQELKSLGIRISLDDFGTGYSSLLYLKRFPVDSIKIDRSFIVDFSTDLEGASITKTIVSLAKNLKCKVVAEGVETIEQLNFLKELECEVMQGYLFSKPLPAQEITALLEETMKK